MAGPFFRSARFVALLSNVDPGFDFDAHYYGPYSSMVDSTVMQLKSMGFLREEISEFGVMSGGFEMRRYDYQLTAEGNQIVERLKALSEFKQIIDSVNKIKSAGDPNYVELSIAAKSYFIISHENRPMSVQEITREAEKYNWRIGEQSVNSAVKFLTSLNVVAGADTARN